MAKETKTQIQQRLLCDINVLRIEKGKLPLKRNWTGAAHWLQTDEPNYKMVGEHFRTDDKYIGFLLGLLHSELGL